MTSIMITAKILEVNTGNLYDIGHFISLKLKPLTATLVPVTSMRT